MIVVGPKSTFKPDEILKLSNSATGQEIADSGLGSAVLDTDGGMTGLYSSPRQPVNRPDAAVPPVNNTMLLFECGARSWHSFISNRQPRRSVILWLHRTREDAIAHWGERAIVNWK